MLKLIFSPDDKKRNFVTNSAFLAVIFILLLIAIIRIFVPDISIYNYALCFHFLNYEYGMLPRGLYGTTIGFLSRFLNANLYFIWWTILIIAPVILTFAIYKKRTAGYKIFTPSDYLMLFAAVIPTTYLPATDLFRMDVILLTLFIIAAYSCWLRKFPLATAVILIIMTLIHDAALFMFIPTVCAISLFRMRNTTQDKIGTLLQFAGAAAAAGIYWIIRNNPVSCENIDRIINQNCYPGISGKLTLKPHFDSIRSGYINYTLKQLNWQWILYIIFSIPLIVIALKLLFFFWKRFYSCQKWDNKLQYWRSLLLSLAPLSNIILFIGYDYNRWIWSFISANIFLLLMLMTDREYCQIVLKDREKLKIKLCCIFLLLLGPGNSECFSTVSFIAAKVFIMLFGDILPADIPLTNPL